MTDTALKKGFSLGPDRSKLPAQITSYDILKTIAVLLMIVDHLGYYFFPDAEIMRAIGRWCVPIWFFLIGYANSRDLGVLMFAGAGVLIAADFICGYSIMPFNILVSIIIVRLTLDATMRLATKNTGALFGVVTTLFILSIPFSMVWEYGTLGILLAMYGYICRHMDQTNEEEARRDRDVFMMICLVLFVIYGQLSFNFTPLNWGIMAAGSAAAFIYLSSFSSKVCAGLDAKLPSFVRAVLKVFGRHTLAIYVVHLVIFKALTVYNGTMPVDGMFTLSFENLETVMHDIENWE